MARTTVYNHITTEEKIAEINENNTWLINEFLEYLASIDRAPQTLRSYKSDLHIFFVWNIDFNNNKDFVKLTKENLSDEHLCCIIRSKKPHAGIDAKRQWLSDRLNEGHVFRKLNAKATVFIEYAPLETAWVPIIGDNYYYLYCLWVLGSPKGNGYGRALMEYCLTDAKEKGKSGVCMLGSKKRKNWLSDQSFAKKFGFEVVDATDNGYELLALSFDGTMPKFAQNAKKMKIESEDLTIYYDMQCPYIYQKIEMVKQYCDTNNVPVSLIQVDTLQKAKDLPCVFNNWGVFYKGNFETVNLLLDVEHLKRILKK